MMRAMRVWLAVLLLMMMACDRSSSRAPVRLGAKSDSSASLAEAVAARLEKAGCAVEREFGLGDSVAVDRALRAGEVDAYVESHAAALTQVLRKKAKPDAGAEALVRIAYVRANLVWAPPLGSGDYAVVFRKDVDERCRAASRTFMATGR
jgi:glycine betaine/choline ABC-type transport system substrate-binding protein